MADLFDQLLVSCPNGGGVFLLHKGTAHKLDGLDTTGLDVRGARMARVLQPASLVLFKAAAHEVVGEQAGIDDLHDAYLDGDDCYVVSTRGNEIVKLDANGTEQRRWTFPGEVDAWHVNCITRWNGRMVFSAFTDRSQHRAYKEPPFETGFVQDLETGARPITGLFQPHSLVPDGQRLLLANSGAFEVHEYGTAGKLLRKCRLDAYTRGVARRGEVLYVGLSKSRNVETESVPGAAVVALDAATWGELGRIRLPVDEIYSLMPLAKSVDTVGVLARIAAHASARSAGALAKAEHGLEVSEQGREQLAGQLDALTRDNDRKIFGLLETVQGKDVQIQNRDQIIRDKDAEIGRRDNLLREKDDQSRDSDRKIFGLLETVQGKDVQIQNRDQIIRDKDAEIGRRDNLLREKDDQLRDSDRKIFRLLETVQGKDVQIQNRDQIIRDKDAEIVRSSKVIAEREAEIREGEKGMRELLDRLSGLVASVATADAQVREWADAGKRKDEQIQALAELLRTAQSRLAQLEQDQSTTRAQLVALVGQVSARERVIAALQATVSWRITRPLRGVRHLGSVLAPNRVIAAIAHQVNKLRHIASTLRKTLGDSEMRARYLTLARVLGPRAAIHHTKAYLRRGGPRPRPPVPVPAFDVRPGLGRRAVILTTPHCDFVAQSIRHALGRIGVEAKIIHAPPDTGYEGLPHFVICPQMFERLPGLYVAFQMEQSVSTRWFTDAYLRMLENSFAILDYSVANIEALVGKGLHRKQFFYMPLGYLPDYGAARAGDDETYDVLFYGDINNDRRRRFVAALEKVCRVKVIHDLFGEPLHAELARAKLVVNIHYYEGALLETTRLWECVSLGKLVVSERASDMAENHDLEKLVDFVDVNDIDGMVERVQYWLSNEPARTARIRANRSAAARQPNRFEYFFYRFLLAWDIISFHHFWELAGSKLPPPGGRLCLNLPEWFGRGRSFDRDNHYGFAMFPGLRHHLGWVGCGMSYKLMIMLARQQRMRQIVICEDDVEFRDGFQADFDAMMAELPNTRRRWDVFSGFLGDLHADARVSDVVDFHGRKLALTDKLISMVFNIYNRSVFDRVSLWDERDRDVEHNTIDRYLEHTSLRVLASYPFLVGHKGELHSTLWGVQNGEMTAMIQRSEQLLGRKIDEFMMEEQHAQVARG